jgi:DNA-binding CsgD family transcriptional regulator
MQDTVRPPQTTRALCLAFGAFTAWLLQFSQLALALSDAVYRNMLWFGLLFMSAFVVFALLARSNRLGRTSLLMPLVSLVAVASGFLFVLAQFAVGRTLALALIMMCSAYSLVCWGTLLRAAPWEHSVRLGVSSLLFNATLGLIVWLIGSILGITANLHSFIVFTLSLVAMLPMLQAVYFFRARGVSLGDGSLSAGATGAGGEPAAGGAGAGGAGADAAGAGGLNAAADTGTLQADTESRQLWQTLLGDSLLPFVGVLLASALLSGLFTGVTYSSYMFNLIALGLIQSLALLLIALIIIVARRMQPIQSEAPSAQKSTTTPIVVGFRFTLILYLLGMAAMLTGPTGVAFARGILTATFNTYFVFALIFIVALGRRERFFLRFLLLIPCTGLFWAQGLGLAFLQLFGYSQDNLVLFGAVGLVLICLLLLGTISVPNHRTLLEETALGAILRTSASAGGATVLERKTARPSPHENDLSQQPQQPQKVRMTRMIALSLAEEAKRESLAHCGLTNREMQVTLLILDGYTAAAVSTKLGISLNTVRFHLRNTYRKCNIVSKAELVELVAGQGATDGRTTEQTDGATDGQANEQTGGATDG